MPVLEMAPDLLNGFMLNGGKERNLWQTDIQCALSRRRDSGESGSGEREWAYLAAACQAEDISPTRIFSGRVFEAAVLKDWDGTFMTRGGAALFPFFPWQRKAVGQRRRSPMPASEVYCAQVPVRELSTQDLLDEFARPASGRDNHLYMRADWSRNGWHWELFARCRYINFPNGASPPSRYIQPITGPVLIGDEEGRAVIGYVAAYVDEGGTRTQEAMLRHVRSLLDLYGTFAGRLSLRLLGLMRLVGLGLLIRTEEYAQPVSLGGTCRYYRYEKNNE